MCRYFSCIATKLADGTVKLLFTESDSHETIIRRVRLYDRDPYLVPFARIECEPPFNYIVVDETITPSWLREEYHQVADQVMNLAARVDEAHSDYDDEADRIRCDADRAHDAIIGEFHEAVTPQREIFDAEYEAARQACRYAQDTSSDHDGWWSKAIEQRNARISKARAAFDAATWADRVNRDLAIEASREATRLAFDAAEQTYIKALSKIEGYVPDPNR